MLSTELKKAQLTKPFELSYLLPFYLMQWIQGILPDVGRKMNYYMCGSNQQFLRPPRNTKQFIFKNH